MDFEQVADIVDGIPHTSRKHGRALYDLVRGYRLRNCLELGFAHGTSSCYIAAALHEEGMGFLTTIDNQAALRRKPDIFTLLEKTGLQTYVHPIFANTSYNWELMKMIEKRTADPAGQPLFDFCFVDGAHTLEADGLAFFLVEKLLKPGGWLLFDDLWWTFASSQSMRNTDLVKNMPEDERATQQVAKVFELLVQQHPCFGDFKIEGSWGWARKKA